MDWRRTRRRRIYGRVESLSIFATTTNKRCSDVTFIGGKQYLRYLAPAVLRGPALGAAPSWIVNKMSRRPRRSLSACSCWLLSGHVMYRYSTSELMASWPMAYPGFRRERFLVVKVMLMSSMSETSLSFYTGLLLNPLW